MIQTSQALLYDLMLRASAEVDFDDVSDAAGFATLIFAVADELGLLFSRGPRQSRQGVRTLRLAEQWIWNVHSRIGRMSPGDSLLLLEPYDFMHRLARRTPIPPAFEQEYILRALDARIRHRNEVLASKPQDPRPLGDRTVDPYLLYRKLRARLAKDPTPYLGPPLRWTSERLDRWHRQFRYGVTFDDLTDLDTLETVSILMTQDLSIYVDGDQEEYKRKLFDCHRHHFDRIDDYGLKELAALSRFLTATSRHMTEEEYSALDLAILRAQIAHPDTNRFHRHALRRNLSLMTD